MRDAERTAEARVGSVFANRSGEMVQPQTRIDREPVGQFVLAFNEGARGSSPELVPFPWKDTEAPVIDCKVRVAMLGEAFDANMRVMPPAQHAKRDHASRVVGTAILFRLNRKIRVAADVVRAVVVVERRGGQNGVAGRM